MSLETGLLAVPFGVALVLVGGCWVKSGFPSGKARGAVDWSLATSWNSNLTVLIALYQLLVGMDLLSAPTLLDALTYKLLAVFFATLVAAAPIAFLSLGAIDYDKAKATWVVYCRVSGVALSALMVMWAVLGQLAVLGIHVLDVIAGGGVPSSLAFGLKALVALLLAMTFEHGRQSIRLIFGVFSRRQTEKARLIWVLP